MITETRVWNLLTLLAMLLAIAVPFYSDYDLQSRGPIPEKRLELQETGPSDLKLSLQIYGSEDRVTLSMTINNRRLDNLQIVNGTLTNTGKSAIQKEDYDENLSVNVKRPWKILAVDNRDEAHQDVPLQWKRVNDQRFEADPALLNPGDRVFARIYVTNTQFATDKKAVPDVDWDARIVGLSRIEPAPSRDDGSGPWGHSAVVMLYGWSLVSILLGAVLFQALYLHLLAKAGLLRIWSWLSMVLVIISSLLSFAVAEVGTGYVFRDQFRSSFRDHWLNIPLLVLHVVVIVVLWLMGRARQTRKPLRVSVPQDGSM